MSKLNFISFFNQIGISDTQIVEVKTLLWVKCIIIYLILEYQMVLL